MSFSWMVQYQDGRVLTQFDYASSLVPQEFRDRALLSGEVPYRAIDWTQAKSLTLSSQWAEITLAIGTLAPERQLSLRSRHFLKVDGEAEGRMECCFMLVESLSGHEVGPESTVWIHYVFPDGTTHECPHFNCQDASSYGSAYLHGATKRLAPRHDVQEITCDAFLSE